jgi:polyhydroxyalkanoate synthesis repressor PhaR
MAEQKTEQTAHESEPRTIKRYPNRKLYDTKTSSYVTLEQIAEMVRAGEDVRIVDNATKEDLTSVTLAQIVFEEEKKRRLLPLSALKRLIQNKGESISGFVSQLGRDIDKQMGKVFRRHPEGEEREDGVEQDEAGAKPGTEGIDLLRDWLLSSQRSFEEWQARVDDQIHKVFDNLSPLAPLEKQVRKLTEQVERLESRLEDLESKLDAQSPDGK